MNYINDGRFVRKKVRLLLQILEDLGIISGEDMTVEAALTKLIFILGLPGLTFQQRVIVSI